MSRRAHGRGSCPRSISNGPLYAVSTLCHARGGAHSGRVSRAVLVAGTRNRAALRRPSAAHPSLLPPLCHAVGATTAAFAPLRLSQPWSARTGRTISPVAMPRSGSHGGGPTGVDGGQVGGCPTTRSSRRTSPFHAACRARVAPRLVRGLPRALDRQQRTEILFPLNTLWRRGPNRSASARHDSSLRR